MCSKQPKWNAAAAECCFRAAIIIFVPTAAIAFALNVAAL